MSISPMDKLAAVLSALSVQFNLLPIRMFIYSQCRRHQLSINWQRACAYLQHWRSPSSIPLCYQLIAQSSRTISNKASADCHVSIFPGFSCQACQSCVQPSCISTFSLLHRAAQSSEYRSQLDDIRGIEPDIQLSLQPDPARQAKLDRALCWASEDRQ